MRFLYDDDNLYVGVICFDSEPDKLVIKDLREDFELNATDAVQIVIDSLHDKRSAFVFSTNPAGAGATARCPTSTGSTRTGMRSGTRR